MKTATLFRAYQKATLAQLWAEDDYWRRVTRHGFKSEKSIEQLRLTKKRGRQRDKLAARITADLADLAAERERCAALATDAIPANCAGCIYDHGDMVRSVILGGYDGPTAPILLLTDEG